MSRIGKKPITMPAGVTATLDGTHITVKGPKGTLERDLNPNVKVDINGEVINVTVENDKLYGNLHGLTRTLIANMVEGVEK